MLPSEGFFRDVDCPFLESGLCERPYCHYRHARRDHPPQILHQIVVETVKKVLLREKAAAEPLADSLVTDVVRELAPAFSGRTNEPTATGYAYNPTPIAELNRAAPSLEPRRHIPVPYTPHRPTRVQVRRVTSTSDVAATYTPTPLAPPDDDEPPKKRHRDDDALDDMDADLEALGRIVDDESATLDSDGDDSRIDEAPAPERRVYEPSSIRRTDDSKRDDRSKTTPSDKRSRERDENEKRSHERDKRPNKIEKRSNEREKSSVAREKSSNRTEKRSKEREKSSNKTEKRSKEREKRSNERENRPNEREKTSKKREKRSNEREKRPNEREKTSKKREKRSNEREKRSSDEKRSESKRSEARAERDVDATSSPELNFRVVDDVMEIFESESDEDAINEQCLKIFEEYVPTSKPAAAEPPVAEPSEADDAAALGKKRVAHAADSAVKRPPARALAPDHGANALRTMTERYANAKKFHETRGVGNSKVRIAHVPYASSLLDAKRTLPPRPEPPRPTAVQMVAKGATRIAHVPNDALADRPGVLEPLASKIPANVRSKFLNAMIDECLKIYAAPEDAYARALHEELSTSKKCSATQIYKNSAVLAISRLRKEHRDCDGVRKRGLDETSHERLSDASWSVETKHRRDDRFSAEFKGAKFYENVARWVLSEQQLRDNGFPRPHSDSTEKGRAEIFAKNEKQRPPRGSVRTCSRCKKDYYVDRKGLPTAKEECIYHPNNKYRYRGEAKYQCCGQDSSSDGCLSASCHVYEYVDYDNLRGFVKTLPKDDDSVDYGVYALDCEMCYTTNGLDLTRVTVVDSSCKVVYESLVKPIYPILDYNTRYSGLTEESMNECTTSLLEVQATFLHMFSNKTILIGHSLESDFKALKLIHDTIVDTSVLFPHKMGPPYKRALRNLSSEYLKKIIQNSVDGHDSAEDATVCMELVIWKLKEELKLR